MKKGLVLEGGTMHSEVDAVEKDPQKLREAYWIGRRAMTARMDELKAYLARE